MSNLSQRAPQKSLLEVAESLADLHVDPFLHEEQRLKAPPRAAVFLCAYWLDSFIDSMDEDAYLLRLDDRDELWVSNSLIGSGCAASTKSLKGEGDTASALILLTALLLSREGHLAPDKCTRPGLISLAQYGDMVKSIEDRLARSRLAASANMSAIVVAAAELGLNPEATVHSGAAFRARCPGTQHGLQIDAEKGLFYCGYCKRGGDVDALKLFAAERQRTR